MKVLVNYADENFRRAQKVNTWTGKHIARFDKVYAMGPEDIDEDYRNAHADIFSFKRGGGLWLWKSNLILKVMEECADGDYIFYVDSGAFFIRNVDEIIASMRDGEKIWVSDCPLLESCFTKRECIDLMEANCPEILNSNQIQGGFFLAVNCPETRSFVEQWRKYSENIQIMRPEGKLQNLDHAGNGFVAHREDQSVLSILCKQKGIRAHRDPSQRGKHPETFYNPNYTYRVPAHQDDHYKTFVFLHKSGTFSPVQIIKLCIKTPIQVFTARKKLK